MSSEENSRRWLAVAFCAAVSFSSCGTPRTGPKLIEADGVRYTACDGAIWARDDGNSKDPGTMTYEVLFKDAQGANHHLTMVRELRITDLPADTPACKLSSPSGGPTVH